MRTKTSWLLAARAGLLVLGLMTAVHGEQSFPSSLLAPYLFPYKTCAEELNLTYPFIRDTKQTLVSDVVWILLNYTRVIDCVEDMTPELSQSESAVQWYMGHMFNKSFALGSETKLLQITNVYSFECLADTAASASFHTCLKETQSAMKAAFTTRSTGISVDSTVREICQLTSNQDPASCVQENLESVCDDGVTAVLKALLDIVSGNKCAIISREEEKMDRGPDPRILQTALYTCSVRSDIELSLLFPMKYTDVSRIQDRHLLMETYSTALDQLCRNQETFVTCMWDEAKVASSQADHFFDLLFNLKKSALNQTLDIFCNSKKVLKENYLCHLNAVVTNASICWNGEGDLLRTYDVLAGNGLPEANLKFVLVQKFLDAAECRFHELHSCGETFARTLQAGYQSWVERPEQPAEPPLFPFLGFKSPTLEMCTLKAFDMQFNAFESKNLIKLISDHLMDMCNYRSPFKPCLEEMKPKTNDSAEVLLFEAIKLDGLEVSMDTVCRNQRDFQAEVFCLSQYLGSGQAEACWGAMVVVQQVVADVRRGGMAAATPEASSLLCLNLSKVWRCYADIVSQSCEGTTGLLLHRIINSSLSDPCAVNTDRGEDSDSYDYPDSYSGDYLEVRTTLTNCVLTSFIAERGRTLLQSVPTGNLITFAALSNFSAAILNLVVESPDETKAFLQCWETEEQRAMEDSVKMVLSVLDGQRALQLIEKVLRLLQDLIPLNTCLFDVRDDEPSRQLCLDVSMAWLGGLLQQNETREDKRIALCRYVTGLLVCLERRVVVCGSGPTQATFQYLMHELTACSFGVPTVRTTQASGGNTKADETSSGGGKGSSTSIHKSTAVGTLYVCFFVMLIFFLLI